METRAAIEEHLRMHPGPHKAREIAATLGLDVKEVNSCLYRGLARAFVKTNDFRWSLAQPKGIVDPQSRPTAPPGRLARLCRYYLACIAKDAANDVSEWAASKFGPPAYAELPALPAATTDIDVWDTPDAQRVYGRFRGERGRVSLFVGYPTRLRRFQSRRGEVFWKVEPLVLFEYRAPQGGSGWPVLADERASLNQAAVRELTGASGPDLMQEVTQLAAELGLDAAGLDSEDVSAALENLAVIRPDWPWREALNPSATGGPAPLSGIYEDGLYNRAVLVLAERSPYTRGLESELAELAGSGLVTKGTAIGTWVDGKAPSAPTVEREIIEVMPLNLEQREAVRRALTRPLTVVTGPPGTGKSQVVGSIIASCVWNRQTVLFASKNNKAVEVVHARVNALGPRPILLRVGTGEATAGLAQHLATILAGTATPEDDAALADAAARHAALVTRRSEFDAELARTIEARNAADRFDQEAEIARQALGPERFAALRAGLPTGCAELLERAAVAARAATREDQSLPLRFFWPLVCARRVHAARRAVDDAAAALRALGVRLPELAPDARTAGPIAAALAAALERLAPAERAATYFASLQRLNAARPLEDVARAKAELGAAMQAVGVELWAAWLRTQPRRLTAAQRRALGDYKSTLEMLGATAFGKGGSLLRKAQQLFPSVVSALPAWAVTNLSARGRLPFAPGYFDLLVIDEASQCDIASVLPLLFRAKRAVIIGDPMQLQHITQLAPETEQQLLADHGVGEDPGVAWAYSGSSLFNLASTLCGGEDIVSLRDHHRSHAAIIGFSNSRFYEGRLRVATRYDRLHPRPAGDPAVRWVHVQGTVTRPGTGGALNEPEARRVVEELERVLLRSAYRGTVGVVSPFRGQANRIRDLVHRHEGLSAAAARADLLVDTVHKFQGDERDLMVFSPVVSRGIAPGALTFLRRQGNLFNVAVTRARSCLVTVGDAAECATCGVDYLRDFAGYVQYHRDRKDPDPAPDPDCGAEYPAVSDPSRVSDWERALYRRLYADGIRTRPQYAVEQYCLDLALFSGARRLDIEVDGERYHRAWDGELCYRDQLRNQRLVELGWDVIRFWVYQVRDEPDVCVERVRRWLAVDCLEPPARQVAR